MRHSFVNYLLLFLKATAMAAAFVPLLIATSLTHVEDMNLVSLPLMQLPKWSNGGLVTVQFKDPKHTLIWMFNRSGQRSLPFFIPGAESTLIYDCDRGI